MADEIFVGSVAVGVVPDLRGFNDRIRADVLPFADQIGKEFGQRMGKAISASLGIGPAVLDSTRLGEPDIVRAGDRAGKVYSDAAKARIDAEFKGKDVTVGVKFDTKQASKDLNTLRADAKSVVSDIGRIVSTGGTGSGAAGSGSGSGSGILSGLLGGTGGLLGGALARGGGRPVAPFIASSRPGNLAGGGGGGIGSIIRGLFSGSGASGTGGGPPKGVLSGLPFIGGLPPQAQIAAIGAGIAALPFIAQAAAGAITFALGGALSAVGIYGAIASGKLSAQFTQFGANAKADIVKIGAAFVPVLQHMMAMAGIVLDEMTPVFASVMKMIAGPFSAFTDAIISSFASPAVKQSIVAVAQAFIALLKAITPQIASDMTLIAQGITNIAKAVAANPKAFADFIRFLVLIVVGALDLIAGLTDVADWIETHWTNAMRRMGINTQEAWAVIVGVFKFETAFITNIVRLFFDVLSGNWSAAYKDINNISRAFWNLGLVLFHDGLGLLWGIAKVWLDRIFGLWELAFNEINAVTAQWEHNTVNLFDILRHDIAAVFDDAIHWLEQAGKDIVSGLFNGIDQGISGFASWGKTHIYDPIVAHIKSFFGIGSPATSMIPLGASLIQGLMQGMFSSSKDLGHFILNVFGGWPQALAGAVGKGLIGIASLPGKALSAIAGFGSKVSGFFAHLFGGSVSSGVSQWAGVVAQALSMLGLPLTLSSQVLYQMQTESGGNPNAINLTDINAQMGDPSRGLLQTIGTTFAAYHVPGTSNNIYDPLANVAAAINYARAVYGPTLMRGGMGMGSGHGYDEGGWLPPGVSLAYNLTGRHERILSPPEMAALAHGSGPTYNAHFDSLTGAAIESHVRTAFQAMNMTAGQLQRQGRRV